ncbi:hypothetical protein BT96DRAFT_978733 [Gymnopus androsaceus JB14]|uniref:F-box domain-containing protein n=1 Tax=Gymnopus androsaceus JB14 TaxID=1447944 RepID=A0A6A4H9U6_9AGAR|nr:hypothetical protein BT96DRAFT_978733 [Gymnopus androsaceus JB14]
MAFLNRRMTTASTSSSSHNGHSLDTNSGHLGLGSSYNANNNSSLYLQRGDSSSNSIMKRVSTMFSPRKKPSLDGEQLRMGIGSGVGYAAPPQSKKSRKKEKLSKARKSVVRDCSDSDLEDLEEIRQPNDLGPPAPFLAQGEEDSHLSTPKKWSTLPPQQKRQRRLSIQSIQSLLSAQPDSSLHSRRRSISQSVISSLHSKNSSFHSRSYSHSLHSLSQSLLEEEAELAEDPVFTATKVTKASAIWAGPPRTTSAPNLLTLLPPTPPAFTLSVRRKPPPRLGLRELPLEVLARVFAFLPRKLLLGLALLSKTFCHAAQMAIYGTLDLRNISPKRQDELNTLLSNRMDLTEMTRELICDDRSSSPTFPSALVLAHMNHLTTLTLPHFSIDLLQHHTAFGLRSVTFLNTDLVPSETMELFTWLDGQVNITTLSFPRSTLNFTIVSNHLIFSTVARQLFIPFTSTFIAFTRSTITLPSAAPTLTHLSFNSIQCYISFGDIHDLGHAKHLLAPYRANTLKEVGVNIDDTLVGGLRPAELVGFLKPSPAPFTPASSDCSGETEEETDSTGLETLQLNFGKSVDKRTVEKVLGAAGAVLGLSFNPPDSETGRGRDRDEKKNVGSTDSHESSKIGEEEHPSGLQNLEISIPWSGPRTEEASLHLQNRYVLYKTIHAVLPRYQALCTLVMRLQAEEKAAPEPQEPDTTTSQPLSILLPAVRVNGQLDIDTNLLDPKQEEFETFSPTDTYEGSAESEGASPFKGRHAGSRSSHASSSQSLASGETAPSAGSIVSLTMFPEPPSSTVIEFDDDLPSQRWESRRISSMTTSGLSVSSSIGGVDWNHGSGGGSRSGSSEPSTPRTPVPETPTTILTESEKKHVSMWIRQCPTLRRVVFLSGAEWGFVMIG